MISESNDRKPSLFLIGLWVFFLIFCCRVYFKFSDSLVVYNILCVVVFLSVLFVFVFFARAFYFPLTRDLVFFWSGVFLVLAVSVFNSDNHLASAKGGIFFLMSSFVVVVFAGCFSNYPNFACEGLFRIFFFWVFFLSALFLVAGHGRMVDGEYYGVVNGMFPHKNLLGRISIVAVMFFIVVDRSKVGFIIMLMAFLFLFFSESKGVFLFGAIAVFCSAMLIFYSKSSSFVRLGIVALGTVGVFVGYYLYLYMEVLLDGLGKDVTLTGRVQIWEYAIDFIRERPILGYGYEAFWNNQNERFLNLYAIYWDVPHAHNGFLDLMLELGFVGLFFYFSVFFVGIRNIYIVLRAGEKGAEFKFFVLLFFFVFFTNLLEKSSFQYFDIQWALYFFAFVYFSLLKRNVFVMRRNLRVSV